MSHVDFKKRAHVVSLMSLLMSLGSMLILRKAHVALSNLGVKGHQNTHQDSVDCLLGEWQSQQATQQRRSHISTRAIKNVYLHLVRL